MVFEIKYIIIFRYIPSTEQIDIRCAYNMIRDEVLIKRILYYKHNLNGTTCPETLVAPAPWIYNIHHDVYR